MRQQTALGFPSYTSSLAKLFPAFLLSLPALCMSQHLVVFTVLLYRHFPSNFVMESSADGESTKLYSPISQTERNENSNFLYVWPVCLDLVRILTGKEIYSSGGNGNNPRRRRCIPDATFPRKPSTDPAQTCESLTELPHWPICVCD